jgi:hypothetical protein
MSETKKSNPDYPPDRERDRSLSFDLKPLDNGFIDSLGLPIPINKRRAQARESILMEAYVLGRAEPDRCISYSRRRDHYANQRRYRGAAYTYSTVIPEIDLLARNGLIENIVTKPGARGWQSRFRATPALISAVRRPLLAVCDPRELIRLKDGFGRLVGYRDTGETARIRRQLTDFNDAIAAADIAFKAPGAVWDENVIRCGRHTLYPARNSYYRVFNESWFYGGRLYGPWWQSARSEDRAHIEINGEHVIELDYPEHHLRMAYALVRAVPPSEPYAIPGWARQVVKWAVLIMFNAKNYRDAVGAVANLIGGEEARPSARDLICAVKEKHVAVADLFHADLGVRLQRSDADMAANIMGRLLKRGITCLSVHDSFLVAARFGGELYEAMDEAWLGFETSVDSLSRTVAYKKLIPQMEREEREVEREVRRDRRELCGVGVPDCSPRSPLPHLVIVLPAPAQLDLFSDPQVSSVPLKDLDGWHRGLAPKSVRRALDHEIRRRRMRQVDLARRMKISKQHLTNVLHGRAVAGVRLASGLRRFINQAVRRINGSNTYSQDRPAPPFEFPRP